LNKKKISSIILACIIISSTIPHSVAFGSETNSTVLNSIIAANATNTSFNSISNYSINRYIISTTNSSDTDSVIKEIQNNSQLSSSVDINSTENSNIIIYLPSSKSSLTDTIKTLNNVTGVSADNSYVPNIEDTTQNDFATAFYISNNSKYIKVNSFNSNSIIPTINLTSDTLANAKYLDCKLITTNNSSQQSVQYFTFGNLTNGDYVLPSIDTNNLKSITVEYNLIDSSGKTIKKAEQIINSDKSSPTLAIKNASLNLQSADSTALSLTIQVTGENSNDLLNNPVLYLNDNQITNASTSYDNSSGLYTVNLNIPSSTPTWNLQVFTSDDSLNLSNVTLSSDALIKFNNMQGNTIYSGNDNVISGVLPSDGSINNLKINNSDVQASDNKFSYTNNSKAPISATYIYGQDNLPINYTANFASHTQGPVFNNIIVNSNNVNNNDTVKLTSDSLNLTGNISSIINSGLSIDSVKYTYNNEEPIDIPYLFTNGNLSINNYVLPNNDETKSGTLTITAHDALSNESNFSFTIYAASGVATPQTSLNSDVPPLVNNNLQYFKGAVTPSVDIGSNPLIDLSKSNFTLNQYADSSLKTPLNSFVYNLSGTNVQHSDNVFSINPPLEDGIYSLTTTLNDIGGNSSNTTNNFILDTTPPQIGITNENNTINQQNYSNSNNVLEDITVSDTNFKSATVKILKDNVLQESDNLSNNVLKEYSFSQDGTYNIEVAADDEAGNESTKNYTFVIDTTPPVANIDNITNNSYYNKLINPEVNVTEQNIDLSASYFDVSENGAPATRYYFTDPNITSTNVSAGNTKYALSNVINNDGSYNITVHIADLAGNVLASDLTSTFYIDTTPPVANIDNITNNTYYNKLINPEVNVTEQNIDLSASYFDVSENGAPATRYYFTDPNITSTNVSTGNTKYALSNVINNDGSYNITVHIADLAGNVLASDLASTFYIDTTPPVANIDNITNNSYYNKLINPEVNVTEQNIDLSASYFDISKNGAAATRYYFTDPNIISTNISTGNTKYALSNVINNDGSYSITVHIGDLAGHVLASDLTSTFYIDTTPPVANIDNIINNSCYDKLINPEVNVTEQNIDLSASYFEAIEDGGDATKYYFTNPNILATNISAGNTKYALSNVINNDGSYNITVHIADLGGNVLANDLTSTFYINTNPVISYQDANSRDIENGQYYNGVISPVITLSDNYNISNYSITINGDNYNGSFSKNAAGNIIFTGAPINEDGTYNIAVTVTDEAGNVLSPFNRSFTLDNTSPYINITGVLNNEYTNSLSVTPTVQIDDTNLDYSSIHFNLSKDGIKLPVSPTCSGDLYNFALYDEGNYSLSVTATDKAGNVSTTSPINFTIDRTCPILNFNFKDGSYINNFFTPSITTENPDDFINELLINGIEYSPDDIPYLNADGIYDIIAQGKDKAGNLSPVSDLHFTIDTTPPAINIANLMDNFYYNQNVAPSVTCTDVNLSAFTMTLNGQPYNGQPITAEGNYELVIIGTDKAGNINRQVIDFVIDKTAPSITIEGVINNETLRDILTPLIGIDDPNAQVTILLDGEDYHGGAITTDGKHTLIVEAVDRAGNISKKVITFFLKTTPPSICVSNVEDGDSYSGTVTPDISFSKDVVPEDTVMTLDGNPYKQGDGISAPGEHDLCISVQDSAGNKTTKHIKFTIASANIISSAVPKILHKILPAKIANSKKNIIILFISGLSVIIGLFGIILFRIKNRNLKDSKETDQK
jgi:hypothetical protein